LAEHVARSGDKKSANKVSNYKPKGKSPPRIRWQRR